MSKIMDMQERSDNFWRKDIYMIFIKVINTLLQFLVVFDNDYFIF